MNPKPTTANLPYSPVRQAGDLYFISGQTGLDPATKSTAAGIQAQTTQLFANLQDTLTAAGLTLNDIVKTTVFLADMSDFTAFNDIYAGYFSDPKPARSTVAAGELPRLADHPLLVEMEAVAYKKAGT